MDHLPVFLGTLAFCASLCYLNETVFRVGLPLLSLFNHVRAKQLIRETGVPSPELAAVGLALAAAYGAFCLAHPIFFLRLVLCVAGGAIMVFGGLALYLEWTCRSRGL